MARPRKTEPHVRGPYKEADGYRVVRVDKEGKRVSQFFQTEEEAQREIDTINGTYVARKKNEKTIREAMKDYMLYMLEEKGNKPRSVDQTKRKLWRFFPDLELGVAELERTMCAGYYDALRRSRRKSQIRLDGTPATKNTPVVSVDYHRNTLSETRTFLNWCIKKQWIQANPLDGVEGVGRRHHGKEQLRIDEARKWIARAMELANRREAGAIAAMMTLLMGMRCTEIVGRVVRDVDDDGRILWIPDSKTAKGRRTLRVPEMLRPYLLAQIKGKKSTDLLFSGRFGKPCDRAWPRHWVQRICTEVDVPVVTAHGQRGLHSTLAVEAGVTARAVADALGHESFATTAQSYAQPDAVGRAKQARVIGVLDPNRSMEGAVP